MPFPKNEYLKFKMSIENNNYNDNKLNGNNNGSSLFGNNNNADIYVDSYLYKQHAPTNNTNLFASNTQIIFGINQNYIPTNSLFSNKNNQTGSLFSNNNNYGNIQTNSLFSNKNNQTGSIFSNNNNIFGTNQASSIFSNNNMQT